MPIDYQQIYSRIKEIGAGAKERRRKKEERQELARQLLAAYASELDVLRSKVDAAKAVDANIRCAYPLTESLASSHPLPGEAVDATLLAADGSQIQPDRHAAIQFCLINVGAICMKMNSGETPTIFTESELLFDDDTRIIAEFPHELVGADINGVNAGGAAVCGTFFSPAVLYPVNDGMRVFHEEQFGPVVPVSPFDDIDAPVGHAVRSNYGQQISIFGRDPVTIARLVDPLVNQAAKMRYMTGGQARVLGLDDYGIEPGKAGDFAVLDLRRPASFGAEEVSVYDRIVYGAGRDAVRWVIAGGEILVDRGTLPFFPEEDVLRKPAEAIRALLGRAELG